MKYIKKVKIAPNFKIEFEILSQGPRKKFGPKIQIFFLPSAMGGKCRSRRHSAKLIFENKKKFAECLALALGKISFKKLKKNCRVPKAYTRQNMFLKNKKKLPSDWGWHSAK